AAIALALCLCLGATVTARACSAPEKTETPVTPEPARDPAMEKLAAMVGGVWVNVPAPGNPFVIELRYEMALGGRAVRGLGVMGKGRPDAIETESMCGWDPVKKCVYYLDFHGGETVYKGTMKATETGVETEFERIVGTPAQFRSRSEMPDADTITMTMFGKKDGEWVELHTVRLKRRR